MELKEFIKTALSDITNAIVESRSELKEKGVLIEPSWNGGPVSDDYATYGVYDQQGNKFLARCIDFEVLVTTESNTKANGSGKLNIYAATIGGEKSKEFNNTNANKIKFSVPITFENVK